MIVAIFRRFAELHVGAEAAVHHVDVLAGRRIDAERLRSLRLGLEQRHRLLEREVGRRQILGQRRARAAVVLIAELQERAVAADAHAHRQVALGIACRAR